MTPLLLIPGYMLDETLWDDVLPLLGVDRPIIHGSLREGGAVEEMARRILAASPPRLVLAGFSMGGYIAREIARLAPERVQSLILVATSSRPDSQATREQRAKAARNTPQGPFRGLSKGAIVTSLHPDQAGNAALVERVRAMGARLGRDVFLRQSLLERGDMERLGAIACPTLVIAAAQDQLRSLAEAEELRDGIPAARLQVVERSGHLIPLEQPAALAQLMLDWLQSSQ
ncbi:alpha/beta hydrolase [Massilia sp. Root351]|jgi:pimeloyl-ACP methyl ester carboxylesterase|uniref:alpha/beta fold hydrolase n=1 Tax=Massilia sp. Root351 TaxID=1736522 RepID=UPI00070BCC42|nr:alpha/beta hydrolase [Massilia sp. Root351]KQV78417.1 alpha/beta hydrolase [Massilia sp. Root351]